MSRPYLLECDMCGKTYPGDLSHCHHCGAISDLAGDASYLINPLDYTYDIETYPDTFTCNITHIRTRTKWRFEISPRINQINDLITFIYILRDNGARMVGYNNVGFDYPVIHFICLNPHVSWVEIYNKAMSIIGSNDRWSNNIWESEHIVKEIDLYKMHHFDNMAKATSLKALEFAMRMDNIEDLPFKLGILLDDNQRDELHRYNKHDVEATTRFYIRSMSELVLREQLSIQFGVDMVNFSDSKIGSTILISELEKAGIRCYDKSTGRKQPLQTIREEIKLGDVIFPYVKFEHPEFERIRAYLASLTITETKGTFKDLCATIDGNEYYFGTGGLHMSVPSQIVSSDDHYQLMDIDVASYYPNLAIKNKMYPAHLGVQFCDIYESMYVQRSSFKKGSPENAALKIALNASFGNSNNQYSPLYDPFYAMQTTINGQLLLCMLVEQLIKIPGLIMVQCNTDGVTYNCPRQHMDHTRALCRWWEKLTCLVLEEALYSRMMIRDVNNYIAEYEGGKLKRKGAYEYNRNWHQDSSSLVIPRAAEAALVRGENIESFIRGHKDPFDFCLRAKVPRSNDLMMEWSDIGVSVKLPTIIRYFVSTNGGSLVKIAPPTGKEGTWKRKPRVSEAIYQQVIGELNSSIANMDAMGGVPSAEGITFEGKFRQYDADGILHDERIHTKNKSKHTERRMSIGVGYLATDCSNMTNFDWSSINYDYYIAEAHKIVDQLLKDKK